MKYSFNSLKFVTTAQEWIEVEEYGECISDNDLPLHIETACYLLDDTLYILEQNNLSASETEKLYRAY